MYSKKVKVYTVYAQKSGRGSLKFYGLVHIFDTDHVGFVVEIL